MVRQLVHPVNESRRDPASVVLDLLILTHNRQAYFDRMIKALTERTSYPLRIIVADNASSESFRRNLSRLKAQGIINEVVLNEENNVHDGWRAGLSLVRSDPFLISDPDIEVPLVADGWLTRLLDVWARHPCLSRLGVRLSLCNFPPPPMPAPFRGSRGSGDEVSVEFVDTTLQLMDRAHFQAVGGFEAKRLIDVFPVLDAGGSWPGVSNEIEAVHLGWNEEQDFPEYIHEKDKQDQLPSYVYSQCLERDVRQGKEFGSQFFARYHANREPKRQATIQAEMIGRFAPVESVLDVGCGLGHLVKELQSRGKQAIGVDPSVYCLANCLAPDHCSRADARGLPFAEGEVDLVLPSSFRDGTH